MDNKMQMVDAVSGATAKAGAATAVVSGAAPTILGFSANEWTVIVGIAGVVIGLLGVAVNGYIRWLERMDKARHQRVIEMLELSKVRKP